MSQLRTLGFGFIALLYSSWVSALGLGELVLTSALNEPLSAEVTLLNIGELSEAEMLINLASKEDFELAGTVREFHLVDLRFSVDLSNKDKPTIRVTSTKPIREPYLDFLIELQWPSGRLLREYTVFLDLPVFATNVPGLKTSTKSVSTSTSKKKASPTPASTAKTSSVNSNFRADLTDAYRVQSGDTLWGIARKRRPDNTSLQQTMQAIYERNASAFINGNMNLLKKGALLALPENSAVRAIDDQAAKRQVAQSAEELQDRSSARELIDSGQSDRSAIVATEPEGVLRLLSPGSEGQSAGPGGIGGQQGGVVGGEIIENELAIAREEVAKTSRENLALREKLEKLEEQLATMSRLVELDSDELSAIQAGLGEEDEPALQADEASESEGEAPVEGITAPIPEEAEPVKVDEPTGVADEAVEASEEGISAILRNNLSVIAGALLLIVLGVFFLLARRNKDDGYEQLVTVDTSPDVAPDSIEIELEETTYVDEEVLDEQEPIAARDSSAPDDEDQLDPIGEADIYLSLGDFSQAEAIIQRALGNQPENSRLHLKRLDVFSAQGDLARFDEYYPQLVALDDSEAIASADRMRSSLTGSEEDFEEESLEDDGLDETLKLPEETPVFDEELDLEDDLELELTTPDSPTAESVEIEAAPDKLNEEEDLLDLGEIELDLDLDLDLDTTIRTGGQDSAVEKSEFDDFDADADLDSLIEGDEIATQLELAQAYIDMGDKAGARDILEDVLANGDSDQQVQAQEIIKQIP